MGLTFRSSKIVYYGPHPCGVCGRDIVKMGAEFGGNSFDQPNEPIYPNTEWHVHVCDAQDILRKRAAYCQKRVIALHPTAYAHKAESLGWFITAETDNCLSGVQTYYDTSEAAWIGAKERVFPNEGECDPGFKAIRDELQPKIKGENA